MSPDLLLISSQMPTNSGRCELLTLKKSKSLGHQLLCPLSNDRATNSFSWRFYNESKELGLPL